jgi:hypothetical protein
VGEGGGHRAGGIVREINRRRALALQEAIKRIEAEFGHVDDLVMFEERAPCVPLKECNYGFPDDTLANDVTMEPWEILMLLHRLHDRYVEEFLGPSEAS